MASSAKPARRWTTLVLVLSLGFNLLIFGLLVGAWAVGPQGWRGAPPRVELSLGFVTAALSDEDRRVIRQQLRERQVLREMSIANRRQEMREMAALLRAEEFDSTAFAELLAAQRGRAQTLIEAAQEELLARLGSLSAAERAAVADRLEALPRERWRGRDGVGDRGGDAGRR